ncbi:MAG TPA: MarR family transcriptional regulator [Candidatus Thermoplasmatota archaeon]|jgi:predicted transcriptional regulator|nr:MarR family transcriptional regulator [Candidatus Thermoplasmatota archaeon]
MRVVRGLGGLGLLMLLIASAGAQAWSVEGLVDAPLDLVTAPLDGLADAPDAPATLTDAAEAPLAADLRPAPDVDAPDAPDATAPDVGAPDAAEPANGLLPALGIAPLAPVAIAPVAPEQQQPVPGIGTVPGVPGAGGLPSPGSGAATPGASAPGLGDPGAALGSQTVAADMDRRQGLGPAFEDWAADAFAGSSAWLGVPSEVGDAVAGSLALVISGLATIAAGLLGFRHVHKDNLLENTFRHQLLALIRASPGLHLREISRRLGTTATNAAYHLRVLEKHGLVRSEHLNGKRVFMPPAGREAHRRDLARSVLHTGTRAAILRAIADRPGSNQSALATRTAQHQGAVCWHLRQLMAAGLVEEERTPRECRYRITALGAELAAPQAPAQVALILPAAAAAPTHAAAMGA